MPGSARRLALGTAAALAAASGTHAAAAEPMPCQGSSFTDKDDAPANRDIREGWFSYSGGRLTANLRLEHVDQQLETPGGSAEFAMYYGARRVSRYVSATTDGETWSFEYGDDNGSAATAATTGAVQPGPNGVIEIEIPSVHAAEGDTLGGVHARSFSRGPANVGSSVTDSAPDSREPGKFGYGADFKVEPCPAPQSEPQPQPAPEAPPGQPTPAPPGGDGTPSITAPRAPFTVTVPRLRARSLKRGRSFRVVVEPSEPVQALVITLRRNGRVLARGRRASLTTTGAVRVKVRRRITRGTYRLRITGRTAVGARATGTVAVRVA